MGKIIKDKYPELDEEDQEAVRGISKTRIVRFHDKKTRRPRCGARRRAGSCAEK
jgi:hypothetical protein